jgi:hypothetical protein
MASKKIVIFLKQETAEIYEKQLKEDHVNASAFFTRFIIDRDKAEKEKTEKRAVGRPRKESPDEREARIMAEPKDTKHPAFEEVFGGHKDEICTRREAEGWCAWMDGIEEKREWAQKVKYYIPAHERRMND